MIPTVHQLRALGHKVRVEHRRRYYDVVNNRYSFLTNYEYSLISDHAGLVVGPFATGGITTIDILFATGKVTEGVAECSKKENYCLKRGVAIALERALASTSACGEADHWIA